MATDVGAIRTYFAKLGLEAEIADIYLALHTYGPQTISQLSRNARVERTRIYRLIDQLMDSNLIEVEPQQNRGVIKAAPIANLHILIAQREQELKGLQDELGLIEQVLARNSLGSSVSHIQFYEGLEAAKQVRQNMLNAHSENLSILYKDLHEEFGQQFAEQWTAAANRQQLVLRVIQDNKLLQSDQNAHASTYPNNWDMRYVAESTFPITLSTFVYDNVVSTLQWNGKTIYGTEIRNDEYAAMQKAFFELLWQQSQQQN